MDVSLSIVGPKVTFFQPDDEVVGKTRTSEEQMIAFMKNQHFSFLKQANTRHFINGRYSSIGY